MREEIVIQLPMREMLLFLEFALLLCCLFCWDFVLRFLHRLVFRIRVSARACHLLWHRDWVQTNSDDELRYFRTKWDGNSLLLVMSSWMPGTSQEVVELDMKTLAGHLSKQFTAYKIQATVFHEEHETKKEIERIFGS